MDSRSNGRTETEEEFLERGLRVCPVCGRWCPREEMQFSLDCHGIPFRLICIDCWERIMEENGYDGEYYTEFDENIWDDEPDFTT